MNPGDERPEPRAGQPAEGMNKLPRSVRRHSESPMSRRLRRGSGKKQRRKPHPKAKFKGATSELKGFFWTKTTTRQSNTKKQSR